MQPEISSKWAPLILTVRPKTLLASFVPVFIGIFLAKGMYGNVDWWIAFCMLLSSILIQTGTNLINDAYDFNKGTDNGLRLGPIRAVQLGILTSQQVFWAGLLSFFLALVVGVPLILKGGMPIFIIISLSALFGFLYTGGPYPLAYAGLGELFVLLFFGWICTGVSFYLQTGSFNLWALLAGIQSGFHSCVILAINNLRDVQGDALSAKRTLPVRFGVLFGRLEIACLAFLPFALGLLWIPGGFINAAIFPFVAFPQAYNLVKAIWSTEPSSTYNNFLAQGAFLHLLFGVLLGIGFVI